MAPPRRGGRFILQGQRGADLYDGIEQPIASMQSLRAGGNAPSNPDPLGLALKARSGAHYDQEANRITRDPMTGDGGFSSTLELLNNAQNKTSPWAPFFQALDEQGVDRVQGGPSADGSNQLTGFGSGQVVNRGGFSQAPLSSWRRPQDDQPMPKTQDEFYARTRRPAMNSLTRGR